MSSAAARTIIHFRRGSGISTTGPRVVPTTTDELAALLLLAVELDRWPGLFHVFQIVPILPETKHSLEKIAHFIGRKIGHNP